MSVRVSPTEKIRAEIDALMGGERDLAEVLEDVGRLGARLIIQTAVEAEVAEFLGRARYQRRVAAQDARAGSRNGYCPTTIKTTAGPVTVERPKLRGTGEKFASRLFGRGVTRSNALESLVIAGYVRGLSDRDVQATLAEALGAEAALSKSTASRVCQAIAAEFDTWRTRSLREVELDYLFLDGSHFRMHQGAAAEPVLAAWGITTDGKPVLVALEAAASESTDAWDGFLAGLADRGLRPPLLVITDGGAGLISAIETNFGHSLRQRCLIHVARNILAKVSKRDQAQVKAAYWAIFDLPDDTPPGQSTVDLVRRRIDAFADQHNKRYPAAVRCLLADRAALSAYLRFPAEHWHRIRHSNLIERSFGETRRRVKVIGRFPGETSCLSLVWAVLDRASAGWRGLTMTPAGLRLLADLRHQLTDPPPPGKRRRHARSRPARRPETVAA
ncbi:MAG: IS256 family transposase [Thermocrispum sp.]